MIKLITFEFHGSSTGFDTVTERAAISLMKVAGWIATLAVVLYGLWKSHGTAWLRANTVLQPRYLKLSVQLDF